MCVSFAPVFRRGEIPSHVGARNLDGDCIDEIRAEMPISDRGKLTLSNRYSDLLEKNFINMGNASLQYLWRYPTVTLTLSAEA